MSRPIEIAKVTITKLLVEFGDDEGTDVVVTIEAADPEGGQIALVDALGMIELGKDSLLRASEQVDEDDD